MTFVGKVLIVVQLLLSVCFMAFAGAVFAVQSNWRQKAVETQTELVDAKDLVTNLQNEKQQLLKDMAAEIEKVSGDRDKWEAEATGLDAELKAKTDELKTVKIDRDNQQAVATTASVEAEMRRVEADLQRSKNSKLHEQLDKLGDEARALEDITFGMKLKTDSLLAKHTITLEELAARRKIMELNDLKLPKDLRSLDGKTPPPPIVESLVSDVRQGKTRGTEFVEIRIGSDDGLLDGHTLYVFRTAEKNNGRAKFLGRIEIVLLTPDKAVGRVVEKAKNGVIQVGDHVTTRL